jgi:hypothetical protein
MAQYLLAVRYADRAFSPEEFRQLCADVPACRVPVEVTPFEMRDIDELLAASAVGEL